MSSDGFDGFLLVNPGDASSSSHKASSRARAFVMRKARADQAWSTRSTKLVDRRKNRESTSKLGSPAVRTRDAITSHHIGCAPEDYNEEASQDMSCNTTPKSESTQLQIVVQTQDEVLICRLCHKALPHPNAGVCTGCSSTSMAGSASPRIPGIDGSPDPFGSVAVVLDAGTTTLLSYFETAISPQITPIGGALQPTKVQQSWLAPSIHHPAFMHAVLCLTALQLSIVQPHEALYQVMTMHHRLRAITEVQNNLSDPDKAASDENIAAVFNLLCVEENLFLPAFAPISRSQLRADVTQRLAHMRGLGEMIRIRGGIRGLARNKALQSFLLRHTAVQAVTSFEMPYLLPKGLLKDLYDYPESSKYFRAIAPMALACRRAGTNNESTEIIKGAECLIKDTISWYQAPHIYPWDALDIQNLYSISIDRFVRWYMENSPTLTPFDGIVSLCSIVFLAFICRSKETIYSAIPSLLLRLKRHLEDPDIRRQLRLAGLDIWVGLLVVLGSEGYSDYEDHFYAIYLDILRARVPAIQTFEELKLSLHQCLWTSRPMDAYALEIWNETPRWSVSAQGSRASSHPPIQRLRGPSKLVDPQSVLSASNPYTNGHPKAHVTVTDSAYNL